MYNFSINKRTNSQIFNLTTYICS